MMETKAKPLRCMRKKDVQKRIVDKSFRVHPDDLRYRTLTVPIDVYDADEIRIFLKNTASMWPQAYETRVAARLLEAVALNLPLAEFIGESSIIPPMRCFIPRKTMVTSFWIPVAIADRLSAMKDQRPKLRTFNDTDAVAIFLIEAVSRYIRPQLQIVPVASRVVLMDHTQDDVIAALRGELQLLRAMYKVVENDLIQERGKCQGAEPDGVSIDEDIFVQLAEAVYHRDEYKAALDKEKLRTKAQLREIEELQQVTIKMKYSIRE
ncbi:MAG: hypothetical protein JZU65_05140 [Chlorobium sp.]|nr:hypothetical protein [Chlorobium sp.]